MNDFSDQDNLPTGKRAELERKLRIIKIVREQMEEKDQVFKELQKKGIPSCIFQDDPFFL
jgi:hypothetical protein